MDGFGAIMAFRELECILCGTQYTTMTGDMVVPETCICEGCLEEARGLDDEEMARYVSDHLEGRERARVFQDGIVRYMHAVIQFRREGGEVQTGFAPPDPS